MKRILSVLSVVAAAVMMAVCVSCKKDEPSKGFDFTNLTFDLLENCIDKDSATVVNALTEQGFVFKHTFDGDLYENKSYGYNYQIWIEKGVITTMKGYIIDNNDKEKFYEYTNYVKNKMLPLFIGYFADEDWENKECTDNVKYFFEKEKEKPCSQILYANEKIFYYAYVEVLSIKKGIGIGVGKSNPDDPINLYNYAKHGCGYDPWK